jgi:magnesium chelatase subunit I
MTERPGFQLLPYSYIVGQQTLCRLLEVAYVRGSQVGGVLVSGERGTGKSTILRSFASMLYGELPVTLPINATDDRVMGGWQVDALLNGRTIMLPGLLEQAGGTGMLYVDEVNLVDDHIVNLILDVVSTGVLTVQRDGMDSVQADVSFMLTGTMNSQDGAIRPQLLDLFGLYVPIKTERAPEVRRNILFTVLNFDSERDQMHSEWLDEGRRSDARRRTELQLARSVAPYIEVTRDIVDLCARVAAEFDVVGHRAEIVMAEAARATAALAGRQAAIPEDVGGIAPYAVMHRRRSITFADVFDRNTTFAETFEWSAKDAELLAQIIAEA